MTMVATKRNAGLKVAEKDMLHSSALFQDSSAVPSRDLRVPSAVIAAFVHLHGAELKVLLVLGRQQARGGGNDQSPFPFSIPELCEATGLRPRAISQAIERLEKHHLIQRVEKRGALPNRYWVLLKEAAPQKIPKAKKAIRPSTHPGSPQIQLVESKVKAQAAPLQKRGGGRRRRDSRPLLQVELPDLLKDLPVDEDQPDQAGTDAVVQAR
jgi:DNA-binding transcriptional ArsR family regulator